jgi:hypothetical protein
MAQKAQQTALGDVAARQLAIATRTVPQMVTITPRWLTHLLNWVPVESGVYRLNRVKNAGSVEVDCSARDERVLPQTFVDYDDNPREYNLSAVQTIVDVHTRVSDLYSKPYNQISEQLRLAIETVKERQESELINNREYGLLHSVVKAQRTKAIAAFGRECTRRGVPPPTTTLFGSSFLTWRGIPLIPSDKLPIENGKSKVVLLRTGESKQGVVGLFQPGLPGEQTPGLSVRFMGIDDRAIASYLVSLYCSLAVLVDDAIAVLDDVDLTNYYEYNY